MSTTPRTAKAMAAIIEENGDSVSSFAERLGMDRSQVNLDINGTRAVSDSRFTRYLASIRRKRARAQLIAARVGDLLGKDAGQYIDAATGALTLPGGLSKDGEVALGWLAREMSTDPEMSELIIQLCKTWGME